MNSLKFGVKCFPKLFFILLFVLRQEAYSQEYATSGDTVRLFSTTSNIVYKIKFTGNYSPDEVQSIRIISEYSGIDVKYNGIGCVVYEETKELVRPGQFINLYDPSCPALAIDIILSGHLEEGHWLKAELYNEGNSIINISDTLYFVGSPYLLFKSIMDVNVRKPGKSATIGEWSVFTSKKSKILFTNLHFKIEGTLNLKEIDTSSFTLLIAQGRSGKNAEYMFDDKGHIQYEPVPGILNGKVVGDSLFFDGVFQTVYLGYRLDIFFNYKPILEACIVRVQARFLTKYTATKIELKSSPQSLKLSKYLFIN